MPQHRLLRASRPHAAGSHPFAPRPLRWMRGAALCLGLIGALGLCGCQSSTRVESELTRKPTPRPVIDIEVYRRAETERAARLAREVERLRTDLAQAEEALVMAESGLRGSHSRADAVSSLAEARIQVERAGRLAPWRSSGIEEALTKLAEASRQVEQGHFGAALFFVYRAQRIADTIEAEAALVYETPGARFIRGQRVNLRAGPGTREPVLSVLSAGTPVFPEDESMRWVLVRTTSGAVGWVHATLIAE